MDNMDYKKVAARIKALRTKKIEDNRKSKAEWSLKALASRVGTSGQRLHLIENGTTKKPSAEILFNLSKELGVTYEYLLFGRDDSESLITLEIPISRSILLNNVIKVDVKKVV